MQEQGTAARVVEAGAGATDRASEVAGQATDYSVQTDLQHTVGESSDRVEDNGEVSDDALAEADNLNLPGPTYQIDEIDQGDPVSNS